MQGLLVKSAGQMVWRMHMRMDPASGLAYGICKWTLNTLEERATEHSSDALRVVYDTKAGSRRGASDARFARIVLPDQPHSGCRGGSPAPSSQQLLAAFQYGLIISLSISGPVLLIKSSGMSDVITLSIGGLTATLFYCAFTYGLWKLFGKGPVALLVQFRTRAE